MTNVDLKAGKVTFALSATPKAYTDQTRALFHLENGTDTLEAEGQRKENGEFRAELVAPLTDDITLSVTFVNGEDRQVQTLDYYSRLYTNTLPQVEVYSGEPLDQYVVDGQLKLGKAPLLAVVRDIQTELPVVVVMLLMHSITPVNSIPRQRNVCDNA